MSLNDLQHRLNEIKDAKVITSNIVFPMSGAVPLRVNGDKQTEGKGRFHGKEIQRESLSNKKLKTEVGTHRCLHSLIPFYVCGEA